MRRESKSSEERKKRKGKSREAKVESKERRIRSVKREKKEEQISDSEKYREGRLKRTQKRGVKENRKQLVQQLRRGRTESITFCIRDQQVNRLSKKKIRRS